MKSPYFKFVAIDKKIIQSFIDNHQTLIEYFDVDQPFYVRIYRQLYSGLIHTIVGQNLTSQQLESQWAQIHNYVRKVTPKKMSKFSNDILSNIVGVDKAKTIKTITNDVLSKQLNLKMCLNYSESFIISILSKYSGISLNTIKTFALFACFKQNILCDEDEDFIRGLQIFLHKQKITAQDINNIKIKYKGQLTLFSLCMWKIRNERKEQ